MLLISSVAQLAIATIHVQEVTIPQSLIDTATIFHGKSSKKKNYPLAHSLQVLSYNKDICIHSCEL